MPFVLDSGLEKKTLPTKADVERAIGKLPALSYYAVAEVDDARPPGREHVRRGVRGPLK